MTTNSTRLFLTVAGITGALAVVLGAVSAHLAEPAMAERLATGVRYLMWHSLALLGVVWFCSVRPSRWAIASGLLFVAGQALFCGALIVSSLTSLEGAAMAAPFGGIAFIAGWLCLAVAGYKLRAQL